MPSSTASSTDGKIAKPQWWSRMGIIICGAVILLWVLRPGTGGGFQPVPIAHVQSPAWTVTNVLGGTLCSTNLAGHVLVVNFWATWCPPCIRELPDLNAFHLAHTLQRVAVIGISVDQEEPEVVRNFVTRNNLSYPVGMVSSDMSQAFGAEGPIPTTFIIDRQGHFAARYLGPVTREELERVTAPLIAAP